MVMECHLSGQNPISMNVCIPSNQLPAMSVRRIILGFDRSFFWISLTRSRDTSHQSTSLSCNFAKFRDSAQRKIAASFPLLPVKI